MIRFYGDIKQPQTTWTEGHFESVQHAWEDGWEAGFEAGHHHGAVCGSDDERETE